MNSLSEYEKLATKLVTEPPEVQRQVCRELALTDLYFLLWFVCGRKDMAHDWLLARCKEVQEFPNGYLDLWARDHYKSTIITVGKTLQDVLNNTIKGEVITVGIFSHTRPIAKAFLRQIKRELESNEVLKWLFPDVLYENPKAEAPKWSEDDGLIVKRKDNPKECTIEAWGLVDGQPIGKHFTHRVYDDVVTMESVNTPEMIKKTTDAWAMSTNLGTKDGILRMIGTRYHFNDTYREVIARLSVKPRVYAATDDGTIAGKPVFLTRELLEKKRRDQGDYIFASQMLQNPAADEAQGFRKDWLRWHSGSDGAGTNIYMLVDAASEKKKTSDYTAIWILGVGADDNLYALDVVRDRFNLTQRANEVFRMVRKWKPLSVGYEKYGMMADVEYIRERMHKENYHFNIVELGGQMAKNDRIKRLVPYFQQGRVFLPESRFYTQYDGRTIDLIDAFMNEEFLAFPVGVHDDMLDSMSRVFDMDLGVVTPMAEEARDRYKPKRATGSAWSS